MYLDEQLEALAQQSTILAAYVEEESVFLNSDFVHFKLSTPCPSTEELSAQAEVIQDEMLKIGYDGALIGHPFDDGDLSYIRFATI